MRKVYLSVLGLVCALAIAPAMAATQSLKGTRPNIILVMTDDQGKGDLACMGNPLLHTPNIDAFYAKSTRFTDFQVSPTCAPTRSAIMSGRHEFRNRVTHTINEREIMALSTTTFPQLLQKAGYQTAIFGKWHLGDEDGYQPYNRGFGEVLIHGAGGIGQSYNGSCGDFPPNVESKHKYFDNVLLHNDTIVQTKGFCTDVFFRAALGWIKQQIAAKKPFFAYIPTNAAHSPMLAPDSYKKRWLDEGWDDKTAGRYGMIENIDDNFGLLMKKLKEWNALENALVIFMTDNGQSYSSGKKNGKKVQLFNANFKTGKGTAYEGGTHVPAFWYWEGVLGEGVDIPALTAHIDLYKTFCDLAGIDIPNGIQPIDGRSLLPLLENPKAAWTDRELFIHRGRWKDGPDAAEYEECGVRTQRWRLVSPAKSPGEFELYDISKDPYESKNVAGQHPEVVEQLKKAFDQWWEETRPLMVNEDRVYEVKGDQAPGDRKKPDKTLSYKHPENPQAIRYFKQLKERGIPDWVPPEL